MTSTPLPRPSPTTLLTSTTTHATIVTKDVVATTPVVAAASPALAARALLTPPLHVTVTAAQKERGKAAADKKEKGRESHPPQPQASALQKTGIRALIVVAATTTPAPATKE